MRPAVPSEDNPAHTLRRIFDDVLTSFVSPNNDYQPLADAVKDWDHAKWVNFFISGALSEVGVFHSYGPEEGNSFRPLNNFCTQKGPVPEATIPAVLLRLFKHRGLDVPAAALKEAISTLQACADEASIPEEFIQAARRQRQFTLEDKKDAPLYCVDGNAGERLSGRFTIPTDTPSLAIAAKDLLVRMGQYMDVAKHMPGERAAGNNPGMRIA